MFKMTTEGHKITNKTTEKDQMIQYLTKKKSLLLIIIWLPPQADNSRKTFTVFLLLVKMGSFQLFIRQKGHFLLQITYFSSWMVKAELFVLPDRFYVVVLMLLILSALSSAPFVFQQWRITKCSLVSDIETLESIIRCEETLGWDETLTVAERDVLMDKCSEGTPSNHLHLNPYRGQWSLTASFPHSSRVLFSTLVLLFAVREVFSPCVSREKSSAQANRFLTDCHITLNYKVTPHVFMWNTLQEAQWGVYREADGLCVSAWPQSSPGPPCKWPPRLCAKNNHFNM